jgi:Leucine-rich repeat (LRR) protein
MACLTSLKLLDVSGNSLSELPEELCQLQKLEKLQVLA